MPITAFTEEKRKLLTEGMEELGLDLLLFLHSESAPNINVQYLTGYATWGVLLVSKTGERVLGAYDVLVAKQMGKDYGLKLQEIWFGYFSGEWEPKQQQLKWNILDIQKTKKNLFIKIRNWVDSETQDTALILKIFDGLLEGIAVTLQMAPPKRIEEPGFFGVWRYNI